MPVPFDLEAITTKLVEAYSPKAVYMFGSFAWGVPNIDSDLDLLIIVEKSNEKFYKRAIRACSALRDLNIPKDVIVLTSEEFSRDAEHPATLAYRIRNDGVILYGVAWPVDREGKQVPKSHDLSQLVQQCVLESPSFSELFPIADILTPYGIAFRYPSELLEPDRFDAEEAVRFAKYIHEFVKQRLDSCVAECSDA